MRTASASRLKHTRGRHALLISICLHLILFIFMALFWIKERAYEFEESVGVDLVEVERSQRKPNLMPLIKPTILAVKPSEPFEESEPQSKRRLESSNPIDEVILKGSAKLRESATLQRNFRQVEIMPEAITSTRLLADPKSPLQSSEFSTPTSPSPAQGIQSSRQAVKGRGKGGLSLVQSIGSTDEGLSPGTGAGAGKGKGRGSGKGMGEGISPIRDALAQIAEHQVKTNKSGKLDLVFVVDVSGSMHDNIDKIAEHLYSMVDEYEAAKIDYRFGVVEFQEQEGLNQIRVQGLTQDPSLLQHRLKSVSVVGNEHAMDALKNSIEQIQFRADSDKHILLVTDEPATTNWDKADAPKILAKQILSEYKNRNIIADVLGFDEEFQKLLAEATGGLWLQIPSEAEKYQQYSLDQSRVLSEEISKMFRGFASQLSRKGGIIDIVLIVDCSLSMLAKSEAVLRGISAMIKLLETFLDIEYQIGLIRFAERGNTLGGIDHISISQPPLSENQLMILLQYAYKGDEHLIDAIVEGLPQIRFRPNSRRYALVVTDEPSTGRYNWDEAVRVCKNLGVQVSVIGSIPPELETSTLPVRTNEIQVILPNQTGGTFKPMINAFKEASSKW